MLCGRELRRMLQICQAHEDEVASADVVKPVDPLDEAVRVVAQIGPGCARVSHEVTRAKIV